MNTLENPLFMSRVNRIIDLVCLETGRDAEVKFVDDEGYNHRLEFTLVTPGFHIWFGHTVFKENKVCINEFWLVDGKSKEWRIHDHSGHLGDERKYRNKLMDECKFNIDDVLKKLDLIIVELI